MKREKNAKTPGRSGSWAAKKTIVGWFSRHGIVVTERSAYNEGWRWKVSLEWDGKPPACVRFNMCFGDALHLRDLKGYGNTLDEAWDNFARNVSSCESVVFRKTHVTGYGAVREKESAEKMFGCGACETLGEFALRLAAAGKLG